MKQIIKTSILVLCAFLPYSLFAQIHFEQNLSWQQIKEKAKKENKYIFVDCYATWCGPCRQMDQEVYPNTALGEILNPLFVSVKVQIDTSKKDDEQVKSWYTDAHQVANEYKVNTLPTFLFFSPDGKLVRKANSYRPVDHFLKLALNATQPDKQEYALLDKFREGQLPDASVPALINLLESDGDMGAASEVARAFTNNYLLKLPDELLFKAENIILIGKYLRDSQDKAFDLFYRRSVQIDQVQGINKGYAQALVQQIITREELLPKLWKDKEHKVPVTTIPDWLGFHESIERKYSKTYADLCIKDTKISYYRTTKKWTELIDVETASVEKDFFDKTGKIIPAKMDRLNDLIWEHIFLHSNNRKIIEKAIAWQKQIVENSPEDWVDLDTYANLLWKMGRQQDAVFYEEKAISIRTPQLEALKEKYKSQVGNQEYVSHKIEELNVLKANLQKIKTGKPTWTEPNKN